MTCLPCLSTIGIPKNLQNLKFRFILLGRWDEYRNKKTKEIKNFYPKNKKELKEIEKGGWVALGKVPVEEKWQTENNYQYNDPKLLSHIEVGNNYGVVCGYGNLRVLDVDDLEIAKDLIKQFPKTFIVRTGSGGYHIYFISDYNKNQILTCGEMRSKNMQVVGASCKHPLQQKYEVIDNEN